MNSDTRRSRPARTLVAILLATAVAVALGVLSRFVSNDNINHTAAIRALIVYWGIFVGLALLIPAVIRYPKETALAAFSTAITLAILEVGCRILMPGGSVVAFMSSGVSSHLFHHQYAAHTRMYMGRFEGKDAFVDTNEDGLRTPYTKEEFKKYRHRVIVLGDSFVLGLGVPAEESFPKRLETDLREAIGDPSVAVINAGTLSYSPFLEKLQFEKKLLAYQPTLVILTLDASDIGDDYKYANESTQANGTTTFALEDGRPPRYLGALNEVARPYYSAVWSALAYPFELAKTYAARRGTDQRYNYYEFQVTVGGTLEVNRFFIYRHPLSQTRAFFDATLGNVDEIDHLAAQIGANFALFVSPRYQHWNPKECPENWEQRDYALNEPYQYEYFRYFEESKRSYPIINLLTDFKATDKYPLVFRGDPHWNAAGNAFVAETVTKHILQRQLLTAASAASPAR